MSNTLPAPTEGLVYTNPTTGKRMKYSDGCWKSIDYLPLDASDSMQGTLWTPDQLINGNTLTADSAVEGGGGTDDWVGYPYGPGKVSYPSSNDSNWWESVTYGVGSDGIGRFVAIAQLGVKLLMYSEDGITWTGVESTNEVNGAWRSVTYGDGKFVAVGSDGSKRVMYSEDGITWTARLSSNESNGWQAVTYGVGSDGIGRFVAVAGGGFNRVMHSEDGITWTGVASSREDNIWVSVTYGNGKFVAIALRGYNRVMHSEDGITWTGATSSNESNDWESVTYGVGSDGIGKFVAVAKAGSNRVMYSEDAITWTGVPSSNESNRWIDVTYGAGKFVAVGYNDSNKVMYSEDGITWTGVPSSNESNYWWGVAYGDGKFVAVAMSGSITNRVMVLGAPEGSDASDLYWNEEKVVVQQSSRTMTSSLSRLSSTISSRAGKAKYLQDSAPPETQTIELPEDSSETVYLTYDNGELWYQPSTNILHIRDSDEWVSLFQ